MVEILLQSNADPTVIGPNEVTAYTIARDVAKRLLVAAIILEGMLLIFFKLLYYFSKYSRIYNFKISSFNSHTLYFLFLRYNNLWNGS